MMKISSDINSIFKKCPVCAFELATRDSLLKDRNIEIIGYQAHFEELTSGLFLFNHLFCKGTFALQAGFFKDLYKDVIFSERATGSKECPGHCLHEDELGPCPANCECAYVREIIQLIKIWPKESGTP